MKKKERLKRFQKMTDSYIRKVYKKAGVFPLVIDTDESLSFKDEGRKITVNISYSTGSGFFFGKILKDYIPGNDFSNKSSLGRYYFEGDDYKELVKNFKKAVRHYKADKQLVEALLEDCVIVEDGFAVIPFLTTAEESEDGSFPVNEHSVIIINLYEVLEKALKVIHSNAEIITLHMDEKFLLEKERGCLCHRFCKDCLFPGSDEDEEDAECDETVADEEPAESEKSEAEETATDAFESEEEEMIGAETDDIFASKSDSKEDDIFGSL